MFYGNEFQVLICVYAKLFLIYSYNLYTLLDWMSERAFSCLLGKVMIF